MVGDILNRSFDLYKAHWRHLMTVALVYYALASAITLALTVGFGAWGGVAGAFVLLIGAFWLTGALIEAVSDIRDGRTDLTVSETFSRVWPRVFPLLGASVLAGIGIGIGLFLLIVPGLVLLTWWSLIPAAVVLEKRGVFESFGRSRALVRGSGWSVFGVIVITFLLTSVVSGVIGAIFSPLPTWASSYLGNALGGTVTAPFQALAITLMYFRLGGPDLPTPDDGRLELEGPEAASAPEPR